jgi:hypothetical protein
MAQIRARATVFPDVNMGSRPGVGVLFVDANTLINLDRAGRLDALLAPNRTVIVTPEVEREAVLDGYLNDNPDVQASASRIDAWIASREAPRVCEPDLFDCSNAVSLQTSAPGANISRTMRMRMSLSPARPLATAQLGIKLVTATVSRVAPPRNVHDAQVIVAGWNGAQRRAIRDSARPRQPHTSHGGRRSRCAR